MNKAATYRDEDYAQHPKGGYGMRFEVNQGEYEGRKYKEINGLVTTPSCLVYARSNCYEKIYDVSCLQLVKDGRIYERRFYRSFTQRSLVTKAKQFAAELYGA